MAHFENFPYTDMHQLNLDWIIEVVKDFLSKYEHIEDLIREGEESITNLTDSSLEELQAKKNQLELLLQQWYDTHSADIANQLAQALAELNSWYATTLGAFIQAADEKTAQSIGSIPADYTTLATEVNRIVTQLTEVYPGGNNLWTGGGSYNYKISGTAWTAAPGYFLGTVIPVTPGATYHTNYVPGMELQGLVFTDPAVLTNGTPIVVGDTITIPEGKRGLVLSMKTAYRDSFVISSSTVYTAIDEYARAQIEEITELSYNLWTRGGSPNYKISGTGWVAAQGYFLGAPIVVEPGKTYYTNYVSGMELQGLVFNDTSLGTGTPIEVGEKIIIPDGKTALVLSLKDSYRNTFKIRPMTAIDYVARKGLSYPITIGVGGDYTTLREGFANAPKGATVYILPGTYDLTQEFADIIGSHTESTPETGLILGNDCHYIFYAGAVVTALFDNSDRWIYTNFSPFRTAANQSFTVEGLNISARNTRYCVHDELGGVGRGVHKFINCNMKYETTYTTNVNYIQCIGGGLGQNIFVVIDGGTYESIVPDSLGLDWVWCISYHNGNNASAQSKIYMTNVYFPGKGAARFSAWGSSNIMTQVYVSNNEMNYPVLIHKENASAPVMNMQLVSNFNNTVRVPGHWVLNADGTLSGYDPD